MGKEKRKTGGWMAFLQSVTGTLCLYLLGVFLLAFLFAKGVLPEQVSVGAVGGLCLVSSVVGGVMAANRTSCGRMPAAMLNAGIFAGILAVIGAAGWPEWILGEHGGVLLACLFGGGAAAGLWSAGNRKRRKKKKPAVFAK